jgi:hypothetical protein
MMVTMTPDARATGQGTGQGAPGALRLPEPPNPEIADAAPPANDTTTDAPQGALHRRFPHALRWRPGASKDKGSAPGPSLGALAGGQQGKASAPRKPWFRRPAAPVAVQPAPPVQPVTRTAPHRRRPGRPAAPTLREQWGKLTIDQGPWISFGLRVIAVLIALSLVGVVVAPPTLSAHDILAWARHDTPESGLGLGNGWDWVAFGALDLAAAVCVLISLYCAIRNMKAGFFALGVWIFAGATAFANYQFGTRPGAPGDAAWFFPAMSVLGPIMLHATLSFVRRLVRGAAGGERAARPKFPMRDWMPVIGAPQDTWGAWKAGGLLGVEKPEDALWAYRAVSLDAGWFGRWMVKKLVRRHQVAAMRARLADARLALAIPGLLPDNAFVALDDLAGALDDDTEVALVAPERTAPVALPAALTAPSAALPAPAVAPAGPERTAPVHAAPVAPVAPDPDAVQGSNVVNLADSARASALGALLVIFEAHGSRYRSWAELAAPSAAGGVALNKIETDLKIGKRRARAAFAHAEHVLPWADAPAAVKHWRERSETERTG